MSALSNKRIAKRGQAAKGEERPIEEKPIRVLFWGALKIYPNVGLKAQGEEEERSFDMVQKAGTRIIIGASLFAFAVLAFLDACSDGNLIPYAPKLMSSIAAFIAVLLTTLMSLAAATAIKLAWVRRPKLRWADFFQCPRLLFFLLSSALVRQAPLLY